METVVVTRHGALIDFLRDAGIIGSDARIIAHVNPDDIQGKRVVGVLPLRLACLAAEIVEVDLNIPAELRGSELTLEQVRTLFRGVTVYRVERVGEVGVTISGNGEVQ